MKNTLNIFITMSLLLSFAAGCENHCYCAYLLSFTDYDLEDYICEKSPSKIKVCSNQEIDPYIIDTKVKELEECLGITIKKDCFEVLIPDDWFYGSCSEEQLLPYAAPIEFCWQKGLDIPEYCDGVAKPTEECPCTCNWRVATQNSKVIVTTPNLKLFKAELARIVLYPEHNNPWLDSEIARCL